MRYQIVRIFLIFSDETRLDHFVFHHFHFQFYFETKLAGDEREKKRLVVIFYAPQDSFRYQRKHSIGTRVRPVFMKMTEKLIASPRHGHVTLKFIVSSTNEGGSTSVQPSDRQTHTPAWRLSITKFRLSRSVQSAKRLLQNCMSFNINCDHFQINVCHLQVLRMETDPGLTERSFVRIVSEPVPSSAIHSFIMLIAIAIVAILPLGLALAFELNSILFFVNNLCVPVGALGGSASKC